MTEAEFQAMLNRSQQAKAEKQELAQSQSQRRQTLLERAIKTNRVVVDYAQVDPTAEQSLRSFFDNDMLRTMRRGAFDAPASTDDEAL